MQRKKCRNVFINGKRVSLSPLEHKVYFTLKKGAGTVYSRDDLLREVWGYQNPVDTRTVDMCVKRLREKIGKEYILTVYGRGYMMLM